MRGDAEHPCCKPRRRLITQPRLINPQEHFLRQLFRHRLLLDHPIQEVDQRVPVFIEENTKTILIAVPHPEHQLSVQIRGRRPL